MMFKLASIKMFNWIVERGYLNIVKMCIPVHDEFNLECPIELADEVSKVLVECMVTAAKPFCPNVFLGADVAKMNKCHTNYYVDEVLVMEKGDVVDITGKILFNLTKNKEYNIKGKEYENFIKDDGPFPNYWVH